MESAAMAAYMKDVENNRTDIMAETIIRNKLDNPEKKEMSTSKVPELPPPETNPRYGNREFHPAGNDKRNRNSNKSSMQNYTNERQYPVDIDPFDPIPQPRPSTLSTCVTPPANVADGQKSYGKSKAKGKDKKGKKGGADDSKAKHQAVIPQQKLWYEAVSPEGYTYYWHIETNESVWEPPDEGFATIAEQEEEAKERALQEELHAQVEAEEAKQKEVLAEEQRANIEREKLREIRKQREKEERAQDDSGDSDRATEEDKFPDEMPVAPYRRDYSVPERPQPYGSWKTVKITEKKPVDLQLPKQEIVPIVVPALQPERPARVFQEKTISRIETVDSDEEAAPSTFKKRKFGNKNVRRRCEDD